MSNPNVRVTYDVNTDVFTFDPEDAVVTDRPGMVVLHRDGDGATWEFVTAIVKDNDGQFVAESPTSAGATLVIRDANTKAGTYHYQVKVKIGTTVYTSPDPQIINSPS